MLLLILYNLLNFYDTYQWLAPLHVLCLHRQSWGLTCTSYLYCILLLSKYWYCNKFQQLIKMIIPKFQSKQNFFFLYIISNFRVLIYFHMCFYKHTRKLCYLNRKVYTPSWNINGIIKSPFFMIDIKTWLLLSFTNDKWIAKI